jgi:hypothetical protein
MERKRPAAEARFLCVAGFELVPAADHRRQRALHRGHLSDPDKEPTMAAALEFSSSRQMSTTVCDETVATLVQDPYPGLCCVAGWKKSAWGRWLSE